MGNKRVNIYIDEDIVNLAKLENANLSAVANDLLKTYFQSDNVEKLKLRKKEIEADLETINRRIKDMIQSGISEDRQNNMNKNIFNELYNIYIKRKENIGEDEYLLQQWINSEKNLQRCKILGKDPLHMLQYLKDEENRRKYKPITESVPINQATVGL